MKNTLRILKVAAITSSFIVAPFIALELINRYDLGEGFPFMLFTVLWLILLLFLIILLPIFSNRGNTLKSRGQIFAFCIKIVALSLLAFISINIMVDQMPCFFGVSNCD